MGSQHKKKKGTDDTRIIIADIKKDTDQDAIRTVLQTGLEMISGGGPNVPPARAIIDFVNVTETIDAAQTGGGGGGPPDTIPPAQVTGLSAVAASNSQINLNWTANSEPDMDHYDVYRGTVSGFTVTLGVTTPVGQPSSNSYQDTGLSTLTTYYYKVGAVDFSINRGPVSVQASATTLSGPALTPSLELRFDGNYLDTSPNAFPTFTRFGLSNGFTTGQFGSSWQCNTPTTPSGKEDLIAGNPSEPLLQMDTSIGFSLSVWIYPVDLTHAVGMRRFIVEMQNDASNEWSLSIDSAGILYFFVTKAGTTYKRQISGFVINSWQHIGATFNGATNTVEVYRNGVAGVASVAADVLTNTAGNNFHIGNRWVDPNSTYYEGRMDELRYYKGTVLTLTQINNLRNTNTTT